VKFRDTLAMVGISASSSFSHLFAPEVVGPVEFHAARSCFVNISNRVFLDIAYFGVEDDF
jgi:hypothetical protein